MGADVRKKAAPTVKAAGRTGPAIKAAPWKGAQEPLGAATAGRLGVGEERPAILAAKAKAGPTPLSLRPNVALLVGSDSEGTDIEYEDSGEVLPEDGLLGPQGLAKAPGSQARQSPSGKVSSPAGLSPSAKVRSPARQSPSAKMSSPASQSHSANVSSSAAPRSPAIIGSMSASDDESSGDTPRGLVAFPKRSPTAKAKAKAKSGPQLGSSDSDIEVDLPDSD